jgi:hypothetical protein
MTSTILWLTFTLLQPTPPATVEPPVNPPGAPTPTATAEGGATPPESRAAPTGDGVASGEAALNSLIKRLKGPDIADRDAAEAELEKLPGSAVNTLRAARAGLKDADARARLDAVIESLRSQVESGASRITLDLVDQPLPVVIHALSEQAGGGISVVDPEFWGQQPIPNVTLRLTDGSLWDALRQLESQGLRLQTHGGDGWRVGKNLGPMRMAEGTVVDAFLFQPMMLSYSKNVPIIRIGGEGGAETFTLQLQVIPEPKLTLGQPPAFLTIDSATDDHGNALFAGQQQRITAYNNGTMLGLNIPLRFPDNPGKRITEIRGTLWVQLARSVQRVELPDARSPDPQPIQIAGGTVLFRSEPTPTGNIVGLGFVVERIENAIRQSRVSVEGFAEQPVQQQRSQRSPNRAEGSLIIQLRNEATRSKPVKLRLRVPTDFLTREVPFVLRDLPMLNVGR